MKAHKLSETLENALNAETDGEDAVYIQLLIYGLNNSIKFYFDETTIPKLQFNEEYMPLPYDLCYYELNIANNIQYGALLRQCTDGILGELFQSLQNGKYVPLGISIEFGEDENGDLEFECWASTKATRQHYTEQQLLDVAVPAMRFISYLNVIMSCSNITYIDVPPPEALNKKRQKKGKPPLFSYKTLNLIIEDKTVGKNKHSEQKRIGPRVHLRRGHIRRYATGKRTWVQSCVVGTKGDGPQRGIVVKDYAVHRRGA